MADIQIAAEIAQKAQFVSCPVCWKSRPYPCTPEANHIARYMRARRRGTLDGEDLQAAIYATDADAGDMVPGAANPDDVWDIRR